LAGYGLHNLSRLIPLGEAMRLQLTGGQITAQRAYVVGLIQAVLSDRNALFAETGLIADEIKLCAPLAVQAIKRIVKIGRNLPVESSWRLAEPIAEQIDKTEDRLEGPRAFAEKREPIWKMR
ncbi:enoyl-CoA hydratase-related protein, partial [Chloroflexota bacterium]